jgi:hypothetical protein
MPAVEPSPGQFLVVEGLVDAVARLIHNLEDAIGPNGNGEDLAMSTNGLDHFFAAIAPNWTGYFFFNVMVIYMVGGVGYFWYHAFKIARAALSIEDRINFFFQMLYNPFWWTRERYALSWEAPEFRAYIFRIERQKYFWIAGAWLIVVLASILRRF